jgi:UDP-N-acetylmuramoylalanine--D-glutamate ligase
MSKSPAKAHSFAGKRVHVIGLGRYGTGREVARVLASRGASVTVSDVKPAAELSSEIQALQGTDVVIETGADAYREIEEADLAVPSPGVPLDIPPLLRAAQRGVRVVGEIEIAWWISKCPIIAVSGTKGKSTTTALIGEILKDEGKTVLVGGNIGRPLIGLADQAPTDALLVTEVSSFQLEATHHFRPKVAVLLNLSPDHLDRHRTMADYRRAKSKLLANQHPDDVVVINRDDPEAWGLAELTAATVMPFSLSQAVPEGADLTDGWLRVRGRPVCREGQVRLRGKHNRSNVLAALAAAQAAGAGLDVAARTVEHFEGLEHRLEVVDVIDGVTFVNDSQATTPEAAVAALEAFSKHVVLIAGGRPKVRDFGALAKAAANRGADLVLIGEAAEMIAEAAREAGVANIHVAVDLADAVARAYERARPGDVVLLSPACASFDMFESMAERGRTFKSLMAEMAANKGID